MMTKSASSCRSLYQLRGRRATGVLLMLLLSVVSVDAAYRGVATRDRGLSFYCEVHFVGVSPRVKIWLGTYRTEAHAALACDVAFYYTNRPSQEFNLEKSNDLIFQNCKPRSAYDSLNDWEERKRFIKAEANALLHLMSQDHAPDFRWESATVPPPAPVRQGSGDVAWTIVKKFRNQVEELREFMAWLMRLSNVATKSTHTGHVQTVMQQPSEEAISQSDVEVALPVGSEQFLNATRVTSLLDSVEARVGGVLWLTLIAGGLPSLFRMFTEINACDIRDASINVNEASFTEQERCESRAECSTKRQKADHPSIELVPDQEDLLTAIVLYVKNEAWQCTGYDKRSEKWRTLPPFSFLAAPAPAPASDFCDQYYSVCGHGSLMCANVSSMGAELVVFNPLTGKKRPLPPLLFPRHPVLLHLYVDSATNSYRVIVAGSSSSGEDHLSKKMEVFDSKTSKWEEMCDVPGPVFGLNEYQAGVCANGILYFISFLEGDGGKGVIAFDVQNGKWLPNMTCPISFSSTLTVIQLVENNGVVYLFSELVDEIQYAHRIDVLEISDPNAGEATCHLRNEFQMNHRIRTHEYPSKHMCAGFGEGMLCIFDNLGTGGVVYDMRSGRLSECLKPRSRDPDLDLVTRNPAAFNLQLSPDSDPFPSSVDDIQQEPPLLIHPYLQW